MKDKIKTIIIIAITIVLTAGTTVAASIAISASNVTIDSDKTDKTNVADALDELYEKVKPICKRAATDDLHKEICTLTNSRWYCSATGSVGTGNEIVYGNTTTTPGELHTGDAFDCDVDGTGYNHRFYYVSDLYTGTKFSDPEDTTTGTDYFNNNVAVLIYYTNVVINDNKVVPDVATMDLVYETNRINYMGPVDLLSQLPSTTQWSNVNLISQDRQIRNTSGGLIVNDDKTTISLFSYTNKAARLLTLQELQYTCTNAYQVTGSLDTPTCRFLLENTPYTKVSPGYFGWWLETPLYPGPQAIHDVGGGDRQVGANAADNGGGIGVRPAIEVAKSDISY